MTAPRTGHRTGHTAKRSAVDGLEVAPGPQKSPQAFEKVQNKLGRRRAILLRRPLGLSGQR